MRRLVPVADQDSDTSLSDAEVWRSYPWPDGAASPFVRANMATSVDGRVTGSHGHSSDVSSGADRRVFRILRASCDAIVVGARTAITENYGEVHVAATLAALRARDGRGSAPRVVVVTGTGDIDPNSTVFTGPRRPIVLTCRSAATDDLRLVADVVICGDRSVDLRAGITGLGSLGLGRILCEGGPQLLNSMFRADLVDDLCATTAPMLIGPPEPELVGSASLLAGKAWPAPPRQLELASVLEEAGTLLCRWVVQSSGRREPATNAARH